MPRDLQGVTRLWIVVLVALVLIYLWGKNFSAAGQTQRAFDHWIAQWIRPGQPHWAHRLADEIHEIFGPWLLIVLRWGVITALMVWKRWRHLAVFVATVVLVIILAQWFPTAGREGTGVVGHPSLAAAGLVVTLLGVVYGLTSAGPWRRAAQIATVLVCAVLAFVLLERGSNTPVELAIGFAGAMAIGSMGYRLFAPDRVFPVRYGHGRTAHLELTADRLAALEVALRDQLGLEVSSVVPFGLEGSGGSTPLRIDLTDNSLLFAKLYATNHLRADRWYKLGRSILYGALEDERSFNSVRRMVEYEDYMLRYLRDHGVRTAQSIGIAELTPDREYLLVTGFVKGSCEMTEAIVDEDVIRSGIDIVRTLWEAGVAHRDIKPSNLLVVGGEVILIDDFFCQVRPSPWRQSVDLANMLLSLALRSDPETVYAIARERFRDDEIAEAFAATRGVTIPNQLRVLLKRDGRNLCGRFRELAPRRQRIPIQRWTLRRLGELALMVTGVTVALTTAIQNLQSAGFSP